MSFLAEIQKYSKTNLRKTDTTLTRPDGSKCIETRDKFGFSHCVQTLDSVSGFIVDQKPDLQVGEILPYLLLGSIDAAYDFDVLELHGVTHILNVASVIMDQLQRRTEDYIYRDISIRDVPETNILAHFDDCFAFIDAAHKAEGRVLVHCMAGVSRSATVVIGYLMKVHHMDYETAYNRVKAQRPSIRPNDGFVKQLKDYSQLLQTTKAVQ